jgi:hypothetical protein
LPSSSSFLLLLLLLLRHVFLTVKSSSLCPENDSVSAT